MLGDDNDSRESNIAELEATEKEVEIEDEAIAEEEFIDIVEDEVNPMLFDKTAKEEPVEPTEEEKLLDGAIGSGNLEIPEQPFNNEEALRNENVNEEDKKAPTTETDGALVDPFASVEDAEDTTAKEAGVESTSEVKPETEAELETTSVNEPVAAAAAPAAEPIAETAPAGPVSSISAAVPEDPATTAAVAPAEQPKKKGKGGIIALILILLLLIGGGVGFFVWYTMHETPENSVKDAISKLWKADDIKVKGDIKTISGEGDDKVESTVTVDASSSGGKVSANLGVKANISDLNLDLGLNIISADKASYIKVNNLKSVTDAIFDMFQNPPMLDDEDEMAPADDEAELSPQEQIMKAMMDGLSETLADTWIKVDAEGNSSMTCAIEKAEAMSSAAFKQKIADIYDEHPFFAVAENAKVTEKDGLKYIPVSISKDEYNAFVKAVSELQEVKDLNSCEGMSFKLDEMKDDDAKDLSISLGVKAFSHELMGVEVGKKDSEEKTESSASLKLSYEKASISAPSDSKTIEEVGKSFAETTKKKSKEVMKKYVEDTCKEMVTGDEQVKRCIDTAWPQVEASIDDEFDDFSIEDLLKQTTGGLSTGLTSAIN